MSDDYKDHFSGHAALYRTYRPKYPDALFEWLASQVAHPQHVWDCATGNGQAAIALARHFDQVTATDASTEQIAQSTPARTIRYRTASAERSGLPDNSVDLITVAQAAHWFDLPAFIREARRVLRPGGVLALWCYGLAQISAETDAIVEQYYRQTLGPYWPPERRHIETGYADFNLPLDEINTPDFEMQASWSLAQLLGYLSSWSATQRCMNETGTDILSALQQDLDKAWGTSETRTVRWPLTVRAGRLNA